MKIIKRKIFRSGTREGLLIKKKETTTLGEIAKKYKVPIRNVNLVSNTTASVMRNIK